MNRIFTILLFGLNFPILSGQIYTENIQAKIGGPLELHDLSLDRKDRLFGAFFKVYPNPNIPITVGQPLITRHDGPLNLDTIFHPLHRDSLPIRFHQIEALGNGKILHQFLLGSDNWVSDYQWRGNSYAVVGPLFNPVFRAYDTLSNHLGLLDAKSIGTQKAVGIVFEKDSIFGDAKLQFWNPLSTQRQWRVSDSIIGKSLLGALVHDVRSYSDSLRVIIRYRYDNLSGYIGPFEPRFIRAPNFMISLHRSSGSVGSVKQLPPDLISLDPLPSTKGYGLLYLDSTATTLRLEGLDSTWQVLGNQTIDLAARLPQFQVKTVPHVLTNQKGIGFMARPTGAGQDTLYYIRLNLQGQLVQRERIDSLPADASYNRSLPGPSGSYIAALRSSQGLYLVKAQPRHRISLPAPETMSENLQVSPLPATDKLRLQLPAATGQASHSYRLYGLTGQMYQRGRLAFSSGKATLDLHELPKGSYILVLEAEEKRYRARVVVE